MPTDRFHAYKFLLSLPPQVILGCVELTGKANHHSEFEVSLEHFRDYIKQINKPTKKF